MKTYFAGLVLSLAACGGSSGFLDEASGMEGIYQVTSHTRNEAACGPGGTALADTDTFVIAATQSVFGIDLLTVMSCASPADCRAKLAKLEAGDGVSFEFSYTVSSVSGAELRGEGASTGFGQGGTCTEGEVTNTTLTLAGTALRVEQAITIADDYPESSDGFCTTDAAQDAARGNTCSELEVLTAERVEPL